jgi:CxxC motif-containing protein (DUF1111 family)
MSDVMTQASNHRAGSRTSPRSLRSLAAVVVAAPFLALGCDTLWTTAPAPGDVFDGPLDGLTASERAAFAEGDAQFARPFAPVDGLGPVFNNVSCASCHSGDGRGRIENALTRFSRGLDLALDVGGPQLQDRAIPGAEPERLPGGVDVSLRLPPAVFGVGLVEAIPVSEILAREDPADADGDGISGRAHFVVPPSFVPPEEPGGGAGPRLGRFGRKAQTTSILQQVVDAYHQDIGITTEFRAVENVNPLSSRAHETADRVADPELPTPAVRAVMAYLRMLAPPSPGTDTEARRRGAERFAAAGCASCHVPTLRTGPSTIAALANRSVALYSDLLLHDMGDALADNRPDGDASGREWRTAPLWGLRPMRGFLDGDAFLLHDGRAHTVEEAVRLHGGEAQGSLDAFLAMPAADRAALLDFVESR